MASRSARATKQSASAERVVIVGHGKAGGALAASLRRAQVPVRLVSGRKPPKRTSATIVLLAVPDRHVSDIVLDVDDGCVIAHVAGALKKDVVHARHRGAFHPLASLDGKKPVPAGCLCAVDADRASDRARLTRLARSIGLVPVHVDDDARAAYHAGAVVAGNLATALLAEGIALLTGVGVDVDVARISLARLLTSTAQRAEHAPLAEALTGPIARGDADTVKKHLAVLTDADTALTYRHLSRVLVDDVAAVDAATKRRLRAALASRTEGK